MSENRAKPFVLVFCNEDADWMMSHGFKPVMVDKNQDVWEFDCSGVEYCDRMDGFPEKHIWTDIVWM